MILVIALAGLIISLWPNAVSLYDLTGEEAWRGQLAGVVHWINTAVRPQPILARQAAINFQDVSPYGVNTFLQQEVEPEKRAQSLEMAKEAGFKFIRQEFQWEDIEIHEKGDFVDRRNDPDGIDAWAKYDNIVDLAEAYDIDIIARLSNPPSWSRALSDEEAGALAPPDDFQDFGDFTAAVADRYKGRIRYYQVWNEPNGNEEWGLGHVDPEAYTELLCLAYKEIKSVDPEAVVLAGALTPTLAMDGRNVNDLIFLQRMYNAGAAECFDIMSAQGYGLWSGASDQRLKPTVINYPHNLLLRDLMVRNNDAHKPIWISELGWNVVPEGIEARFGRVNEEQQARYTVEAFQRAASEWPWVGVSNVWFLKRPADWEKEQSWYYFRLLEPDFTSLPVYDALVRNKQALPEIVQNADWKYGWDRSRPFLFAISAAILFFSLLWWLAPNRGLSD
ncbi:MAG: cellulase family glycosylhydrolase [Candidatus Promineifilaceae bacterium]|nr:cellulase family glycosylhydrolase [Candidatus Promineifilaceae bacterium]